MEKKVITAGLIGLAAAAVTGLLYLADVFEGIELKALDQQFRFIPADRTGHPRGLVIVVIDENSIEHVSNLTGYGWPWPRMWYGKMIRYVTEAGAKALIFDLTFTDPEIDRGEIEGWRSEQVLEEATADSGKVYHAYLLKSGGLEPLSTELEAFQKKGMDRFVSVAEADRLKRYGSAALPSPGLIAGSRGLGFVTIIPDGDNVVRRWSHVALWGGKALPSLALTAAMDLDTGARAILEEDGLRLGEQTVPVDRGGRTLLWWYKSPDPGKRPFEYVSAANLLQSVAAQEGGQHPAVPPKRFENKIVLFGSNAPELADIKATPIDGSVPGVEVQATALANLLRGDFLHRADPGWVILFLVVVCVLLGLLTRTIKSVLLGAVMLALISGVTILFAYWQLAWHHRCFDMVPLLAGGTGTFVAATAANYFSARQRAKMIRNIFEYYLDKAVVRKLIADPGSVRLGGEQRRCTVLFMDVANFSEISEQLDPEQVVRFMNRYLDEMTGIIVSEGGFVDKYVGDEIVAIFGAPYDLPDHARCACRSVLRMKSRLSQLQEAFREIGCRQEVFFRAGLETGPIVVGNMGSEKRMNYTGMGDVMNTGSRVEGINKIYGTRILVGEKTYQEAKDGFAFREVDQVKVMGKAKDLRIYELRSEAGRIKPEEQEILSIYAEGLDHYRARNWADGERCFAEASGKGDPPSTVFARRCRSFLTHPPPPDWDGVYVMPVK